MERKIINDASAYIRGLAALRGRNSEWAELAVREAASLAAEEALQEQVIDYVATSLRDLLEQVDHAEIAMNETSITLDLADAPIYEAKPDWRTEFLATITNPNLVLILGMIGFYGIILEFYNPGSLVPGTIGVICLILAGYALQLLPVNYAGLALLLVGLALMFAEALSPSFGILGVGGVVAFVIGGIILFDSDIDAFKVAWPLLAAIAVATAGFIIVTVGLALRLRRQAVTTGVERIVGEVAVALADFTGEGQVKVGAEIWKAHSDQPLQRGDSVIVKEVCGLILSVEKGES
jgi:membrane-bound serine protease (ClpP class)